MDRLPLVFRLSPWVLGIVAAGLAISVAGTVLFADRAGASLETAGLAGLALLFAVGLAEGLTSRVVLTVDALEIRSNFRRTSIPRAEILRAVGEKGVPVVVQLRSGRWVKLPVLGSGPHANTLRAWIRRTPHEQTGDRP